MSARRPAARLVATCPTAARHGAPFGREALSPTVEWALALALALGLLTVLALGALWPAYVWLLPPLMGGAALLFLWSRPDYAYERRCFGFLIIFDYSVGVPGSGVRLWRMYYLSYLAGWFVYHTFIRQTAYVRGPIDAAVLAYLILATASLALIPAFGNDPRWGREPVDGGDCARLLPDQAGGLSVIASARAAAGGLRGARSGGDRTQLPALLRGASKRRGALADHAEPRAYQRAADHGWPNRWAHVLALLRSLVAGEGGARCSALRSRRA